MIIKTSERGLLFKNDVFVRILMPGKYNLLFGKVDIYSVNEKFAPADLSVLLENKCIKDLLDVYEIKDNQIALRYFNNKFVEILKPGVYTYWKSAFGNEIKIFQLNEKFSPQNNLNNLLEIEQIKNELLIHDIKDNEIGLYYCNNNFKEVLLPGRYAFWKSSVNHSVKLIDLNNPYIADDFDKLLLNRPEIINWLHIFVIEPFEKGLFFMNKKYLETLEPGKYYFWKGNKDIRIDKVDMRLNQLNIAGQEIMTKDKVTLRFNFVCQYKIQDPYIAIIQVANFANELYVLLQLVLREYVGGFTLDEILLKKEEIGEYVGNKLKSKALELGVDIIFAGVKDVILPGEIKEILNQVLIAEKKALANVIMRREETASTRSLLNTAKLMEDNELLFKLKEMEYIERISEKISQISVSGGTQLLEQLKQLFVPLKQ